MRTKTLFVLMLALACLSRPVFPADMEEKPQEDDSTIPSEKSQTVVKEYKGMRFEVAPDRPIKEYDGYVAPIPLDEYVYIKFAKLTKRVDELQNKVSDLEEKMKTVVRKTNPKHDLKT